ncbi:uncharacterized protein TRIADDRAFT_62411 [Trichoplax adhaerens]|uniref:Transcription elongation factor, mitochondrial n=1 Tax=Trichoplax adhaerens TaxID=10228 RepID=B3SDQ4_TRIAD|nr:hypothetical protein TRIADDRAFT_62411 [Trichoplax adhaerens]EDV19144.1 hypothetical protein TRIADDRAFT_62411 [Trichoplax adhaerens]|eukprot:XP_002118377.1 hypothetical protein TRIADDRAFT_62411 [Trichoplax adhaerens]
MAPKSFANEIMKTTLGYFQRRPATWKNTVGISRSPYCMPFHSLRFSSSDLSHNELLERFNMFNKQQLLNMKGIGQLKANLIIDYRKSNGSFSSLDQLQQLRGFSSKLIDRLLKSENHLSIRRYPPLIDQDLRKSIQSIVSIDLGFKNFAYVHINRELTLLDWRKLCFPTMTSNSLQTTYENVIGIRRTLPAADVYVIEQASAIPHHGASFNTGIPLRILEAFLYCVLQPNKVVSMNAKTVQSYFNLSKGPQKKTDAINKVLELMNGKSKCHNVTFTNQQISEFTSITKKDDLSDCLLQALTFYDKEVFDF